MGRAGGRAASAAIFGMYERALVSTCYALRTVGMYRVSLRMKMGDDGSSAV